MVPWFRVMGYEQGASISRIKSQGAHGTTSFCLFTPSILFSCPRDRSLLPFFPSRSYYFIHFIVFSISPALSVVMFSKLFSTVALVLALSLQVHGHAAIVPVLGVTGTPARSDVQRPSTASPCGKTNPATAIDASTPVVAAANGQFKVTVTNFNACVFLLWNFFL